MNTGIDEEKLAEFIAYESISPDPNSADNCLLAATWLKNYLQDSGFTDVQELSVEGAKPSVYARTPDFSAKKETILFYGHYDVQPANLNSSNAKLWGGNYPFNLQKKDGKYIGRGIADDKGQVFTVLESIRNILDSGRSLKYNIKILIEGEEEIGSRNLPEIVRLHKDLLTTDIVLVADTDMPKGKPRLNICLRGLNMFQIDFMNGEDRLHSGVYGGAVLEPTQALAKILAEFTADFYSGKLPEFSVNSDLVQDSVVKKIILDGKDDYFIGVLGDLSIGKHNFVNDGESKKTSLSSRENMAQSTFISANLATSYTINGLHAGCAIDVPSTVIDNKASAIVSFRTVTPQDPHNIKKLFVEELTKRIKSSIDIDFDIRAISSEPPYSLNLQNKFVQSFMSSLDEYTQEIWQEPLKLSLSGGTIGIVGHFKTILQAESIMFGFATTDSRIHGAGEFMYIDQIQKAYSFFSKFFSP